MRSSNSRMATVKLQDNNVKKVPISSKYTKYDGVLLHYFKKSSPIFAKLDNLKEKVNNFFLYIYIYVYVI